MPAPPEVAEEEELQRDPDERDLAKVAEGVKFPISLFYFIGIIYKIKWTQWR